MFDIGDKIRMRYTGMHAEIVEDYLDGSYCIIDSDGEETIAFADDIVLDKHYQGIEVSSIQKEREKTKKKNIKGLSTEEMFFSKHELKQRHTIVNKNQQISDLEKEEENLFSIPTIKPSAPTQQGCFLAFLPISATSYSIYIVNDTAASFGFEFRLYLNQELTHGFDKIVPAYEFFSIGELRHDQFNDSPKITLNFPRLGFEKEVKLKYKKFVGMHTAIPLMGISTYGIAIFNTFPPPSNKKSSLHNYTQTYQADQAEIFRPINAYYQKLDLMEHASFNPELDLHAEKLVNDTSEFSAKELFDIQLDVLDKFVQKAITLGIKEIYIVHGIGKGKLRTAVHNYLKYQSGIKKYKNDFHDRYGFGATIVQLK